MTIKAVWLTNVDSQVLNSRDRLKSGLERLHSLGFNTIYPSVWQRGFTLYPSPIAQAWTGEAVMPDSPFVGRDLLAEIIELATPLKLRVIPWFEYGLMLPPRSQIAVDFPELIAIDSRGSQHRIISASGKLDPNVWLNPCQAPAQDFIVELISDVVERYPVEGIQLDDHFGWPRELGFDGFSQHLFQQQRGKFASASRLDPVWQDWGCDRMTELLHRLVRSIKSIRNSCQISISPNPLSFSRRNYLADWQAWHELGLIDELVLQVYRDNLQAFKLELNQPEVQAICQDIPTAIGILTGLKTKVMDDRILKEQITATLDRDFAGVAYFFYETVINQQLTPTVIARTQAQLAHLFTGFPTGKLE